MIVDAYQPESSLADPGPTGVETAGVATPSRGSGQLLIVRQRAPVGTFGPAHACGFDETLVVVAGKVRVDLDGKPQVLGVGDIALLPADIVHTVHNDGDTTAEWLLISPAGQRFYWPNGEEVVPPWAQ